MKKILTIFLFLAMSGAAFSQDYQYSQQYTTVPLLNPALTGMTTCQSRFSAQYRNQWSAISTPFQTMSAVYEQSFLRETEVLGGSFLGGGVVLFNDMAGSVFLRNSQAQISAAYHQRASEYSFLSGGFLLGIGQNAVQGPFSYDLQFDGRIFDTALPSGEALTAANVLYFDVSGGIAYSYAKGGTSFSLGMAGFHLNRPNVSLLEGEVQDLSRRWVLHAGIESAAADAFSFLLQASYQWQGTSSSTLMGAALKINLDALSPYVYKNEGETFVSFGALYRIGDALIPNVRLQYQGLGLGIAYDVNISDLRTASNTFGGWEVGITYDFGECYQSGLVCPRF